MYQIIPLGTLNTLQCYLSLHLNKAEKKNKKQSVTSDVFDLPWTHCDREFSCIGMCHLHQSPAAQGTCTLSGNRTDAVGSQTAVPAIRWTQQQRRHEWNEQKVSRSRQQSTIITEPPKGSAGRYCVPLDKKGGFKGGERTKTGYWQLSTHCPGRMGMSLHPCSWQEWPT